LGGHSTTRPRDLETRPVVECPFDKIAIGLEVEVTFVPSDGGPPVPMFKPAAR
jgi:hypothetical protein